MSDTVASIGAVVAPIITLGTLGLVGPELLGQRADAKRNEAAKQALAEQRKQNAINNAQQAIARRRSIAQSIAQTRVQQAEQVQTGYNTGTTGAASAIGGDAATAIGAGQTQAAAAQGIARSRNTQSGYELTARSRNNYDTFANFANIGRQAFFAFAGGGF